MTRKPHRTETQFFTFAQAPDEPFALENGETLAPVTLAYETCGHLSPERDNAILVFHALSGSAHMAGYNPEVPGVGDLWIDECQTGWWDLFVGPHKTIDTEKYFVICANYIGGCYGSTGPRSINPETGKPYGGKFPLLTHGDVVNSQIRLLDHLGIDRLLCVAGGSLGGVMALDLAMRYPERVHSVLSIAAGARATTLHKLFNFEQIFAIEEDPNFNYGDYYEGEPPSKGLTLARMISHKSFVHLHLMEDRARGEIIQHDGDLKGYRLQHQIESYILHAGKKFITRFDANTYLRIITMWQQFDLAKNHGGDLVKAFEACKDLRFLIFSIDSDVCFWPEEQAEIAETLKKNEIYHHYVTVHSEKGHDSFLLEPDLYVANITCMLREVLHEVRGEPAEYITLPGRTRPNAKVSIGEI